MSMRQILMIWGFWLMASVASAQANFAPPKVVQQSKEVKVVKGNKQQESSGKAAKGNQKEMKSVSPNRDMATTSPVPSASTTSSKDMGKLKDYELELKAYRGDANAQYILGKRWVLKGDSVSVAKGVNQLKEAARRGSREAQAFLKNHQF